MAASQSLPRARGGLCSKNFRSLGVSQKRPTILPHIKRREDALLEFIVATVYDHGEINATLAERRYSYNGPQILY